MSLGDLAEVGKDPRRALVQASGRRVLVESNQDLTPDKARSSSGQDTAARNPLLASFARS